MLRHQCEVARLLLLLQRQGLQRLDEAGQYGQRRADFVRDIGDKVAPHGLGLLRRRDIAREHELLADAVSTQLDGQARRPSIALAMGGDDEFARPVATSQIGREIGVAQQVSDELLDIALGVDGQMPRGVVVAPDDAGFVIQQQHTARGGLKSVQHAAQPLFARGGLLLTLAQQALDAVHRFAPDADTRWHRAGRRIAQPTQNAPRPHQVDEEPQPDDSRRPRHRAPGAMQREAQARTQQLGGKKDQRAGPHGRP